MAVALELHNTGDSSIGAEIQALVEHHLGDRLGDWRVSIVGSRESDGWEMKVWGPNGFERSYTLVGSPWEHQALAIANVLLRLVPAKVGAVGVKRISPITYKGGAIGRRRMPQNWD
jgi:hypothetical protein